MIEKETGADAPLAARVFAALADGRFHSGEDLAHALGVSRSAVWKAVAALRELGAPVHAVRNRGYRLANACEPLDAQRIHGAISDSARSRVRSLEALWALPSTNAELLARGPVPPGRSDVLLAEHQTAGRGRRGRAWLAPPGGAICLSLSWSFAEQPRDLGALSLATGVCVLRALRAQGVADVGLKWPNDLLIGDRKLGGILIELRAESAGPTYIVVGIGLNVSLGRSLLQAIAATGLEATDLAATGAGGVSRNVLAATIIAECLGGLAQFGGEGLRPFIEEWRRADALRGRTVSVHAGLEIVHGAARGVDLSGALLLETPQGLRKFVSGEVSVRPVQ